MTELEIDKALALAIGWKDEPNKMRVSDVWGLQVWIDYWANFGYRDWNVIGPIAKKFGLLVDFKTCVVWQPNMSVGKRGDTPQKAIALAVIGAHRGTET